jgi:hypothetical protein
MCEKYNSSRLKAPYIDLAYSHPYDFDRPGNEGWIHPDPIWALITRGVLTKKEVFDCLTSDVDTREKLIEKMVTKYPTKASVIRMIFTFDGVPFISGSSSASAYINGTYRVPTSSSRGETFNGWTISPASYTATSDMNDGEITVNFHNEEIYTLTASYTLSDNTLYTVTKTVSVSSTLKITGPSSTMLDFSETYRVPTNLPNGVTFNNWIIDSKLIGSDPFTPILDDQIFLDFDFVPVDSLSLFDPSILFDPLEINKGTTSRTLNVKFTSAGIHTLTANFTLPNNETYSATYHVRVYLPQIAGIFHGIKAFGFGIFDTPILPQDDPRAEIYVENALATNTVTYEWECSAPMTGDETTKFIHIPSLQNQTATIRCRLSRGNEVSPWSNTLSVSKYGISYN